jgi:hypothetical protein
MPTTAHMLEMPRRAAAALVERERHATGSKMRAYENIGSAAGASASWLRKFIGRDPSADLSFVVGCNLLRLYEQWCDRVETDNENRAQAIRTLRENINAAVPGDLKKLVAASRGVATSAKAPD